MKYTLFILLLPLLACIPGKGPNLPKTWTKDFTITVYNGGGRSSESIQVTYTADSCLYDHFKLGVHTLNNFKLSDTDKAAILAKLREYDFEKVRTKDLKDIRYDKSTTRICVSEKPGSEMCMTTGDSQDISANWEGFDKAYTYLVHFASQKH